MTAIASLSRYFGTRLGHQRRGGRRHLGRLEDHGVARGDRADGGPERQREREVPRADDQHRAVGLVLDPPATGQLRHFQPLALAARPLADVLRGDLGLGGGASDVGEPRLERLAVQVLTRGLRRWRPRSRPSASPAREAAVCATRCCGSGPSRTSHATGGRRPECRVGWLGAGGATDSVVMAGCPS